MLSRKERGTEMRQLGTASIHSYRWDLVFLHGSLLADPSPGVSALASEAARLLDDVRAERALYERAERQGHSKR